MKKFRRNFRENSVEVYSNNKISVESTGIKIIMDKRNTNNYGVQSYITSKYIK